MKKIIVLLIAFIIAMPVFAACTKRGGSDFGGVVWNERNGEMYVESKEGKERLKITYTTGYDSEWIKHTARSFLLEEENSKYYIVLDGDADATASVSSKLESGRGLSDIYMVLASNWQSYAALGQLEPLDDLYDSTVPGEDLKISKKMKGSWLTYGKTVYNNQENYYAFPWNENITGIVYNETMFNQYGWVVPETVDEMLALCEKIVSDTNGQIAPFVYPGTVGGYFDFIGTTWWLQASGIEGLDNFMNFDSPEVFNPSIEPSRGKVKALNAFNRIFVRNAAKYTLSGSMSKNHIGAQLSFGRREAAMIPNGNWLENESGKDIADSYKMMRVPYISDAQKDENGGYKKVNYTGSPDFMIIPKKADNKTAAKKLLSYMTSDKMLRLYTEKTGAIRPFDYSTEGIELSAFAQSCIDIWSSSESWFDNSTSALYRINKAKKYLNTNPYTTLMYNPDTITPASWAASEYQTALDQWDSWLAEANK